MVIIRKPRLLKVGLAFGGAVAVGALVLLAVLHYCSLYQDAAEAKELLLAAEDVLREDRLDATGADLARAEAQFEEAARRFHSSKDALTGDPLMWALRNIPGVDKQVSAAEGVLLMGGEASEIGIEGVAVTRQYQAVRSEGDGGITEKAMALLESVDPHMTVLSGKVEAVLARREQIGDGSLLSPLRRAVEEVDEHRQELEQLVDTYDQAAVLFPDLLGFRGPRTYLVLAQNNAELLPTGGLISVYGTITLNGGRVEAMTFGDAVEFGRRWQEKTPEYVAPPVPLRDYLLKGWSWNLDLANWSPDFPTTARRALYFFQKGGGGPVDGVIGINVNTLQRLLGVTGAVPVEEYGVVVDSGNALDVTEALTRSPLEPGSDRKAFVAFLAEEMLRRLMRLPSDSWTPLLNTLGELRDEKNVLFFSFDPTIQAVAHEMALDGALHDPPGDYLMLVEASVNSTKLNIVIDESVDLRVALDELGTATSRVSLHYRNDLASWEEGRDPDLVRRLMLDGVYGGYLRLFVSKASRPLSATLDDAEAGLSEVSEESGKRVFGRFFALPRDSERDLSFTYVTPGVVDFGGEAAEYRLFVQKQPGTGALPLRVHFSLPPGARAVALELDGEPLAVGEPAVETDLSRDRDIVLRYETDG